VIHEETTTEIEIPGYQKKSNVVQGSFPTSKKPTTPTSKAVAIASGWEIEPRWAWRLLAVICVLLLSLLML